MISMTRNMFTVEEKASDWVLQSNRQVIDWLSGDHGVCSSYQSENSSLRLEFTSLSVMVRKLIAVIQYGPLPGQASNKHNQICALRSSESELRVAMSASHPSSWHTLIRVVTFIFLQRCCSPSTEKWLPDFRALFCPFESTFHVPRLLFAAFW